MLFRSEPVSHTRKIRSGCEGDGKGALVQENKSAMPATNNDRHLLQPVSYDARGYGDGSTCTPITGDHEMRVTDYSSVVVEPKPVICLQGNGIVRRLTPTECARLQGFADWWGIVEQKDSLTDEEYRFWLEVRNTHAAINGKKVQDYTEKQMLTWYNKLWTDSAEYKMWGNGIALPPALYCLQGIVDALNKPEEDDDSWLM